MSVTSFIINKLDRFEEFKGKNFNSYLPTLGSHNRMLRDFNTMKSS